MECFEKKTTFFQQFDAIFWVVSLNDGPETSSCVLHFSLGRGEWPGDAPIVFLFFHLIPSGNLANEHGHLLIVGFPIEHDGAPPQNSIVSFVSLISD